MSEKAKKIFINVYYRAYFLIEPPLYPIMEKRNDSISPERRIRLPIKSLPVIAQ